MASIDLLRNVLELECKKAYTNRAVMGGLDMYLRNQAGSIRQAIARSNPQLLASFDLLDLANSDYSSLSINERRVWVKDILDLISRLEAGNNSLVSAVSSSKRNNEGVLDQAKPQPQKQSPRRTEVASTGLDSPITIIRGITPNVATKFAKLDVRTIADLLYLYPRRYIDYSQSRLIAELKEGEEQTVIATIWQARVATFGRKRGTEAIVGDETGNIRAVWFNQPYLAKGFPTNARLVLSGTVGVFKGQKVFESPEWELLKDRELIHTGRLVPVYPLTQGLAARRVRKWVKEAIDGWAWRTDEFLPRETRNRCQLLDLLDAITQIHYPDNQALAEKARERLAFDELFLLQLAVLSRKRDWQESKPGNAFRIDRMIIDRFLSCLPFSLTPAQERVLWEILSDLKQGRAMSRLLQGDVGSGKTVIATLALLIAVSNGYQGVLMAPTEVLAEQHFDNICAYLTKASSEQKKSHNIRSYAQFLSRPLAIALLVGSLSTSEKEDLHNRIKQGELDIVIGTHAIIQKEVEFANLGLAVIDEQHRFGVLQRSALRQKGFNPHVLVMTATPIPRTMALTLYGDLDLSVIDELPPGRQVAKTKCLEARYRGKAYDFLRKQVEAGRQVFIICPLVEESESLEAKAATTEYERLSREVFPYLKLGLLHGQMHSAEKESIMRSFRTGQLDILVSTSVVEVGIDVPKASTILVEGADHFGLSQLHQFRGRVGRGKEPGYCILISEKLTPEVKSRLQLMEKINDGFALAEKDLELRGPGEFFGTQQSGLPPLKIAKLSNLRLLELARQEAITLFRNDPDLKEVEHRLLKQQLSRALSDYAEWS